MAGPGRPRHRPVARAGWGDLPAELHREILRLVPLSDATAARQVSPEMRDEVDEVWRAWGIRATAEDRRNDIRSDFDYLERGDDQLIVSTLAVWVLEGSHAHHLASMGLWWLALLVAEESDMNGISWTVGADHGDEWASDEESDDKCDGDGLPDQSPLMVAVRARRSVGRGADGKVEWVQVLGDEEVARMVRTAVAMGADVNRRLHGAWPLMTYCAARGCVEAVKMCLAAGAEVDAPGDPNLPHNWPTALVHDGYGGHEAVVEALLEAGASAKVAPGVIDLTIFAVCEGQPTPGIVRRLTEAGADVDVRVVGRRTVLFHAARDDELVIIETLVDLGADVTTKDMDGWTPIHWARSYEMVQRLAARGASIQSDGFHESPLQLACGKGRVNAVRALIELGADVHYIRGQEPHGSPFGSGTSQ